MSLQDVVKETTYCTSSVPRPPHNSNIRTKANYVPVAVVERRQHSSHFLILVVQYGIALEWVLVSTVWEPWVLGLNKTVHSAWFHWHWRGKIVSRLLHPLPSLNLKGVTVGNKVNLIPSSSVPRRPIPDSIVQLWGKIRRKEDFDDTVPPWRHT